MSYYSQEYLLKTLELFRGFRAVHDERFSGRESHGDCLVRLDCVIENLEQELAQIQS